MAEFPVDYAGRPHEQVKTGDGDIVGQAGQAHRSAAKPGTEQIAAWGGFKEAETEVNETADRAVEGSYLEGQSNG